MWIIEPGVECEHDMHAHAESDGSDGWVSGDDRRRNRQCADGAGIGDGGGGGDDGDVHGEHGLTADQSKCNVERDIERGVADIRYIAGGASSGVVVELRSILADIECEHDMHGDAEPGGADGWIFGDDRRGNRQRADGAGISDGGGGGDDGDIYGEHRFARD